MRSGFTISDIGRRQHGGEREPRARHDRDDMQFPAIDPPMPARFGPMGFSINGGVRKLSLLAMLLMPDASTGSQDGAINGNRPSKLAPWLDQAHQMTPQTANLSR